jgi:hypothetical protein
LDLKSGERLLLATTDYLVDEIAADQGRIVMAARKDGENDDLYQFDLKTQRFTQLLNTQEAESSITLQGAHLYYTANYNHRSEAYCYDLETRTANRLTNCSYASTPATDEKNGCLYYIGLNSAGFDLYRQDLQFQPYILPERKSPPLTVPELSQTQVTHGRYTDNLKTLAPKFWSPYVTWDDRVQKYGLLFSGGDAIGDFPSYTGTVTYDRQKQKLNSSFDLSVNYFTPLQLELSWLNEDESTLTLSGAYPLLKRLSPGFSELTVGGSVAFNGDYQGPEFSPMVRAGFQYPKTKGSLELRTPIAKLTGGGERFGVYSDLNLVQYLPGSQVSLTLNTIDDPDNPDKVFPVIRGYQDNIFARKGMVWSAEYSKPLISIHNGWWNPNVYFEDLTATLFTDQVRPVLGENQSSYGLELHLETKTFYSVPIDWGVRFSKNAEGEQQIGIFANASF